jgi:hypothetical protein
MPVQWSDGWQAFTDDRRRRYIERELAWELSHYPNHPLAGARVLLVGSRNLYVDFILRLDDGRTFGHVTLAWRPDPPLSRLVGDEAALSAYIRSSTGAV